MKQAEWVGLKAYDVIGGKLVVTPVFLWRTMRHPLTLLHVFLISLLLFALNVHGFRPHFSFIGAYVLVISISVTLIVIYMSILLGCIALAQRFPKFYIYLPIVGAVSMALTSTIGAVGVDSLVGEPYLVTRLLHDLPVNLTISFVAESMFLLFVVPIVTARLAISDGDSASSAPIIQLGGKSFEIDQIIRMASQDHYVEVVTPEGQTLVRARLADAVAQMPDGLGVVPHRSHWVSKGVISGISGKTLVLTDGEIVPIARGRLTAMRDWTDTR